MALVVLLFGASGSGKSTLLEELSAAGSEFSIHIKVTDRPPREYDGIEIRCQERSIVESCDYVYQTYGYLYGIQRAQIDDAILQNRHHFIICNDLPTIHSLKRDYPRHTRVIFHRFDAPREALEQIQAARKIPDDEIGLRLAKTATLYRAFADEPELFDDVVDIRYGDSPEEMLRKMKRVLVRLMSHDGEPFDMLTRLAASIEKQFARKHVHALIVEPDYVFIIMAMNTDDRQLEDIHTTIKSACHRHGFRAERVDEPEYTGSITEKIRGSIERAEFIVADLTHERPNVYYEVGYAHALGKKVILTAQEGSKLHFDVQGERVRFYRNMTQLSRELEKAAEAHRTASSE